MMDPVHKIAMQRMVQLSAEIEAQIDVAAKSSPLQAVVVKAREDAADALAKFVEVDPEDAKSVRFLQNEVLRFRDLIAWLRQMLHDGVLAEHELSEDQQAEARDLVLTPEQGDLISLPTTGHDDD